MSQLDLFPQSSQAVSPTPSVDTIRARIEAMLAPLRAATTDLPFTARELAYWEVVTPQMTNWLPADELAAVCAEFSGRVSRLAKGGG